ncbi:ABC transporter G family member 3 [Vitis vinifera]|uniref:ABC transporter G family member 3 n=1 Tax=Vitis vinifera TaxID=29760 RepID=A0A438C2N6_VITVI|nr:ABC transporter G family member 3 [Vitis vinifera]
MERTIKKSESMKREVENAELAGKHVGKGWKKVLSYGLGGFSVLWVENQESRSINYLDSITIVVLQAFSLVWSRSLPDRLCNKGCDPVWVALFLVVACHHLLRPAVLQAECPLVIFSTCENLVHSDNPYHLRTHRNGRTQILMSGWRKGVTLFILQHRPPHLSQSSIVGHCRPHPYQRVRFLQGNCGASIVWKDLTVTIKGKRKYSDKVVKSSNGYTLPGTMTVIMGPAKSGKSTLLRALAGRLHNSAKMYGEVFVNGTKRHLPYGSYGFVERETTLIGSLTVREFLYYSALLQLPGFFCQKKSVGLPSGERRRVSIARELVMRPHILFIDEPLYHLDSAFDDGTLKKLASTGCTLIFTIYQSSTEVFGLFDRICLLSNGNTLFFGETLACLQHFSNAGFPCPIMQSPSDHFLRAINTDLTGSLQCAKIGRMLFSCVLEYIDSVAIRTLEATYKSSVDAAAVESMIIKLTDKEGPLLKSKGKASSATRIAVLTWSIFRLGHSLSSVVVSRKI